MATQKDSKRSKRTLKARKVQKDKAGTLTVKTYTWGTHFQGSRADILNAGLAEPRHLPRALGAYGPSYRLPLDYSEKYHEACFGPNFGPIPVSWDASVVQEERGQFAVFARFNDKDLDIRTRTERAMEVLNTLTALLQDLPPVPINEQLRIKAKPRAD